MNITRKQNGTKLVIALDDRLDTITAPELDKEVRKGFDGIGQLVFDFSDLEFITSAGLRVLITAKKAMHISGGSMKVIRANETVRAVFELTGLDSLLSDE